ncbi:MAG: hypothetical protein KIS67_27185 [Verrucomicrobiae bacterium]|nr:hypothetical protein [Verrucomicrobiae bacterium]
MSAPDNEREAVRTTIVGGRPPGSGRSNVTVPRGIEVLVKKAAVDPEFRERLIEQRGGAASDIGLELDPAENAMLSVIPSEQLAQIIGQTTVPLEQRRVFLGRIAAAMLAVLGASLAGCQRTKGIQPDYPATEGIRPDRPAGSQTNPPSAVVPPPDTAGIRPERPSNDPPAQPATPGDRPQQPTNEVRVITLGIQPDRVRRSNFP